MWRGVHGMWRYVERNVLNGCNARCGVMHNCGRYQWCDLTYGIAKWNSVLWEGLVWYGEEWWCDVECGVVWNRCQRWSVFGVEWCNVKCGGMMWRGARCNVLYIPHQTTFPAQHTIPHLCHHISRISIPPDHTAWRGIAWCGIWCDVECFAMPDVGCCALFILMWLWCGIRCDVEYVRHGVMSCNVRCEMWWCDVEWLLWCMGNVVVCRLMQDVKCGCGIRSDVEWFDAILDMVRCGMTVEMQCGVVSCGIVRRVVYIWMW